MQPVGPLPQFDLIVYCQSEQRHIRDFPVESGRIDRLCADTLHGSRWRMSFHALRIETSHLHVCIFMLIRRSYRRLCNQTAISTLEFRKSKAAALSSKIRCWNMIPLLKVDLDDKIDIPTFQHNRISIKLNPINRNYMGTPIITKEHFG